MIIIIMKIIIIVIIIIITRKKKYNNNDSSVAEKLDAETHKLTNLEAGLAKVHQSLLFALYHVSSGHLSKVKR